MSGTKADDPKPKKADKPEPEPVERPLPAPRELTMTERETLRARLQKKFH